LSFFEAALWQLFVPLVAIYKSCRQIHLSYTRSCSAYSLILRLSSVEKWSRQGPPPGL